MSVLKTVRPWTKQILTALVLVVLGTGYVTTAAKPLDVQPQSLTATTEIVGPLRGFYRWNDQEIAPQPEPAQDSYQRYSWAEIEPTVGVYNFAPIEEDLRLAAAAGRKHAFRIRAVVNGRGLNIPSDLADQLDRGWWGDADADGKPDTYIPDWNDPDFLLRLEALIDALGQRFGTDPRIAWVDVGFYGSWGEWHTWPFTDQYPTSAGATVMRAEHRRQIVDWMLAAFPQTPLIMGTDDAETLLYALRTNSRIGWRRDSLGSALFTESPAMKRLRDHDEAWALLSERWRSAPVIAEFINPSDHTDAATYQLALEQVRTHHISLVSNGNSLPWKNLSAEGRVALLATGRAAGYRFALRALHAPGSIRPNQPFVIETDWTNDGNAPAYENWEVVYQLRNTAMEVVWEEPSKLDLRALLPTTRDSSGQRVEDTLLLPFGIPSGNYSLTLLIRDPSGYRSPLRLAITGVMADGSYLLGTIAIRG